MGVGGEVDMLGEVEALEEVQELSGRFAVVVVNVESLGSWSAAAEPGGRNGVWRREVVGIHTTRASV